MAAALQPVPNARRTRPELTQARLKELLHYDPETGLFTWLANRGGKATAGQPAGSVDKTDGYVHICVDRRHYKAHRLAFLFMTGVFPSSDVDHANRSKADNRWENLREATESQNGGNASLSRVNTSGYRGVFWSKQCRKWQATIRVKGKSLHLGRFDSLEDAAAAYASAARDCFGEFANAASGGL